MRRSGGGRAAGGGAGAEMVEDVVEAGEGEVRVVGEDALAVGVDGFGGGADAVFLRFGGGGEGEGVEAAGFYVDRIIANAEPAAVRHGPGDMDAAGEDAEGEGVIGTDGDEFVVGDYFGGEELEDAVLGGFNGDDVAGSVFQGGAQVAAGFTENPPVVAVGVAVVGVTFRFHGLQEVLIDLRETGADVIGGQAEEVDDHHVAGAGGEVAAVAVGADVAVEARAGAEAEMFGLGRGDDEAGAVEFYAG